MPELYKHEDRVLYIRDDKKAEFWAEIEGPFWKGLVSLGMSVKEMNLICTEGDVEISGFGAMFVMRGERHEMSDSENTVLAIEFPFPFTETAAPIQAILDGLRSVLLEEEIVELYDQIALAEGFEETFNHKLELEDLLSEC